jgi:hypothetical protein
MQAEFYKQDAPEGVLGRAVWDGSGVRIDAEDESVRASLARIFRPVPVVVEDPSLRSYGTSGPVVLQPGGLLWFRAAAEGRAASEGLRVRLVPLSQAAMGWDPAGAYRTFNNQIERRELAGTGSADEAGRAQ